MKAYVKVDSVFGATGYMQPKSIVWTDDKVFLIEKIRAVLRESLEILAPGGNHIPFFYPFGEFAGRGLKIFAEEIDKYEAEFGPC